MSFIKAAKRTGLAAATTGARCSSGILGRVATGARPPPLVAFIFIWWVKPFEGRRLNLLVVYCLGFSKVTTVALSAAFDVRFNLSRIITTVIGIVIIVIRGVLTIIPMIAIIVGAITAYMSVSRNIHQDDFRPRKWVNLREKYFNYLDRAGLANAYVSGMQQDLNLVGTNLNVINTCLTVGCK